MLLESGWDVENPGLQCITEWACLVQQNVSMADGIWEGNYVVACIDI